MQRGDLGLHLSPGTTAVWMNLPLPASPSGIWPLPLHFYSPCYLAYPRHDGLLMFVQRPREVSGLVPLLFTLSGLLLYPLPSNMCGSPPHFLQWPCFLKGWPFQRFCLTTPYSLPLSNLFLCLFKHPQPRYWDLNPGSLHWAALQALFHILRWDLARSFSCPGWAQAFIRLPDSLLFFCIVFIPALCMTYFLTASFSCITVSTYKSKDFVFCSCISLAPKTI